MRIRRWAAKAKGQKEPKTRRYISVQKFCTGRGEDFIIHDSNDSNRIIVFSSKNNLKKLFVCKTWLCDGTFKVAPKLYTQIYTVHGLKGNGWILPFCYALLPNKTAISYREMFQAINAAACKLDICLRLEIVLMHFENAAIVGLLDNFHNTKPQGCFFHLTQTLWKNLSSGIQKECKTNIKLLTYKRSFFSLACLPKHDVQKCFIMPKDSFPGPPHLSNDLNEFCDNMTRTYTGNSYVHPLYAIVFWNVYDRIFEDLPRTNNAVEGWNRKLNYIAGCQNPSFFRFLDIIKNEQESTDQSLEFEKSGNPPRRRLPIYRKINSNIKDLVVKYDSNQKTQTKKKSVFSTE